MNPNGAASQPGPIKVASGINFLLGVWFFVSPWVFGAYTHPSSWNNWIFGVVIAVLAAIRFYNPAGLRIFSWVNMAIGIWVFCSPWALSYTGNTARFVNSLCVSALLFILAITAWSAFPRPAVPHRM